MTADHANTKPAYANAQHHAMRRAKQQLDYPGCQDVLNCNTSGTLALIDADGFPYAVPLSYVYVNQDLSDSEEQVPNDTESALSQECLYFHSALEGHKVEALKHSSSASFCVIDADNVVPEKYTTAYRSVIAFGRATIVTDEAERHEALTLLGLKYNPGQVAATEKEIAGAFNRTLVIKFEIEILTGKQGKLLANQ